MYQALVPGLSVQLRACARPTSANRRTDMTTIAQVRPLVIGGVDTHSDVHVAAVITDVGGVLVPRRSRRPAPAIGCCCVG